MDTGGKITMAVVTGAAGAWIGDIWVFIALTIAAVILDYCTGMLAGRANEGLNSKKALTGLQKKLGILSLLCLGLFLDIALNYFIADALPLSVPFDLPVAHVVTMWIIITEAISVIENLERLGVFIPKWLQKALHKTKDKLSEGDADDS